MIRTVRTALSSLWGKKKALPVLGIDIRSSSVTLLELGRCGYHYTIESYAAVPLPHHCIVESVAEKAIVEPDPIVEALISAHQQSGTKVKTAAIAVAGSAVITKRITVPANLNDDNMETQVASQADQYIPYPLDEVTMDFEVLGNCKDNPQRTEVLLAACRRETVDQRVNILERANITTKIVDIEAYSIERAFELIRPQLNGNDNGIVAIVDLGETATDVIMATLNILIGGRTVYTQEQVFSSESKLLEPFKTMVTQHLASLLHDFFASQPYDHIDQLVLAGRAAATPGLANTLQDELRVATVVANPLVDTVSAGHIDNTLLLNDASALMVACGLAMRSF